MKQERQETDITKSSVELANNITTVGVSITLSGIGLVTSGGVIENPRLLAAGGAVMSIGLFIFAVGRVGSMLNQ